MQHPSHLNYCHPNQIQETSLRTVTNQEARPSQKRRPTNNLHRRILPRQPNSSNTHDSKEHHTRRQITIHLLQRVPRAINSRHTNIKQQHTIQPIIFSRHIRAKPTRQANNKPTRHAATKDNRINSNLRKQASSKANNDTNTNNPRIQPNPQKPQNLPTTFRQMRRTLPNIRKLLPTSRQVMTALVRLTNQYLINPHVPPVNRTHSYCRRSSGHRSLTSNHTLQNRQPHR